MLCRILDNPVYSVIVFWICHKLFTNSVLEVCLWQRLCILQNKIVPIETSGGSRISPRRGRQLSRGGGAPTYDFAKISPKLHEIERIWTPGGGRPKFYYVDPPLETALQMYVSSYIYQISAIDNKPKLFLVLKTADPNWQE